MNKNLETFKVFSVGRELSFDFIRKIQIFSRKAREKVFCDKREISKEFQKFSGSVLSNCHTKKVQSSSLKFTSTIYNELAKHSWGNLLYISDRIHEQSKNAENIQGEWVENIFHALNKFLWKCERRVSNVSKRCSLIYSYEPWMSHEIRFVSKPNFLSLFKALLEDTRISSRTSSQMID